LKNILITGGLGFVGSYLVNFFHKKKYNIIIIEHPSKKKLVKKISKKVKIIWCDITRFEELKKIKLKRIDVLLHLAAQSSGPRSFSIPEIDIKLNIIGTLNIIKLCKICKINHLILASSFVVYGEINNKNKKIKEKVAEDFKTLPGSVYANSKLAAENLLRVYAQPLGIKWNVLRMFNVYGEGQNLESKDQGIVGIFSGMIINSNQVTVNGKLNRFRDIVNLEDIAKGWELCINKKKYNQIFNLGSGKKTTIKELIFQISKVLKKNNKLIIKTSVNTAKGDMFGCYADLSKVRKLLGYKPSISLKGGLKKMLKPYIQHKT
jgi:UDP-glucose 4-epimerase